MGFLDKLKKTLWTSFFGEPERPSRKKAASKKKSPVKKKKKISAKKKPVKLKLKLKPKKIALPKKQLQAKTPKIQTPKLAPTKTLKTLPIHQPKAVNPPKLVPAPVKVPKQEGTLIGTVTHFFPQVNVAAIKIQAKILSVGDEVYFKGVTTSFKTKIASMQINRVPVTQAAKGSEIGILVKKRVREGDQVFKL